MRCPFCGSDQTEIVSAWGGQMITSQCRCRGCRTYFEAVREEFGAAPDTIRDADPEQRPA
jgi:transcriptional regulator NrdR family protein